jgi:hypothetical protein
MASPSPPLLPVPHSTTNNVSRKNFALNQSTQRLAALSIRSAEWMPEACMVYASHAFIWAAENIFIPQ